MYEQDSLLALKKAYHSRNLDTGIAPDLEELCEEFDVTLSVAAKAARTEGWYETRLKAQEIESKALAKSDRELVAKRAEDLTQLRKDLFLDRAHVVEQLKTPLLTALMAKIGSGDMGELSGKEIISALKLVMDVSKDLEKQIEEAQKGAEDTNSTPKATSLTSSLTASANLHNAIEKKKNPKRFDPKESSDFGSAMKEMGKK